MTKQSIILCRPLFPGNIGSISRVMANFSFSKLTLIDPPSNWRNSDDCHQLSSGYKKAFLSANVHDQLDSIRPSFDSLIGFTRRAGSFRPLRGEFSDFLDTLPFEKRLGFVFGNERTGLSHEELEHCEDLYTIGSSEEAGSINLALAVGIVLYTTARHLKTIAYTSDPPRDPVSSVCLAESDRVALDFVDLCRSAGIYASHKRQEEQSQVYLKRIFGRSRLVPFELKWLMNMIGQLKARYKNDKLPNT